ncbi:hypothetical protein ONZ45_g2982 [Pleurotus djamor]|nr:hypothetical protein ONZ45_g2982 [Pleurotus djamor]
MSSTTLNNFALTWTLFPVSPAGTTPSTTVLPWETDRVYFYDNISQSLLFASDDCVSLATNSLPEIDVLNSTATLTATSRDGGNDPGMIARFPKWGMRIHCVKETHPSAIIPRSNHNYTYLFTHRDTLSELFRSINMDVPVFLNQTLNESSLNPSDSIREYMDYSVFGTVGWYHNTGDTISFHTKPVSLGPSGAATLETVLVRLNTTFAPNGEFLAYGDVVPGSQGSRIGYDAAVCLQMYEPWIVEARNSSVSSGLFRLVGKGSEVTDGDGRKEKLLGSRVDSALRNITEKSITEVFSTAHASAITSMIKDNSNAMFYAPTSMSISFSSGSIDPNYPYMSYTRLDAKQVEKARAMADVHNVLSYLSGCDNLVARSYPNRLLSNVRILPAFLIAFTLFVAILGLLAGLFVPKLPLGVPRRDFHAYSWAAMYVGGEMKYEPGEGKDEVFEKSMEMEEIERRFGDARLRYAVN